MPPLTIIAATPLLITLRHACFLLLDIAATIIFAAIAISLPPLMRFLFHIHILLFHISMLICFHSMPLRRRFCLTADTLITLLIIAADFLFRLRRRCCHLMLAFFDAASLSFIFYFSPLDVCLIMLIRCLLIL